MKKHLTFTLASLLTLASICPATFGSTTVALASQGQTPQLPRDASVVIAEAYHLWKSLGGKLWPGWNEIEMPMLYITQDYEFAIGFPRSLQGFQMQLQNEILGKTVQVRKRILAPDLTASFPIDSIPAVVIGTPTAIEASSGQWVFTALHEMFHVLQFSRGEQDKVAELNLGPQSDASWQLNFPFLYKNEDVMRSIHLQGYLLYLTATSTNEVDSKYNAGTALDSIKVYRAFLKQQDEMGQLYKYSIFQEWKEGVAYYTEYKLAEAAATQGYQPTKDFQKLADYKSYQQLWDETYKNRIYLVKHAGRAARSRLAFYHIGLGKGILLDHILPDWKNRYFAPRVWLDDLIIEALGANGHRDSIVLGATAPDFTLTSLSNQRFSIKQNLGKVMVINFWQTWCPPCIEEVPHLKTIQEKYRQEGVVVLGVTDRVRLGEAGKVRKFVDDFKMNYQVLLDEKGDVARQYGITGYPQTFVIDREGRIIYNKLGYVRGEEAELEMYIRKALNTEK
jgi:peroxiredoxin